MEKYMDNLGLLRIHVIRGINLAAKDVTNSNHYIMLRMGKQKLKTRVVRKNVNPRWNEELTLPIVDPSIPIKLQVFDKATFILDDKMGDAEFEVGPFLEAVRMQLHNIPSGTLITNVKPSRQNCLAEESDIVWENGRVKQHMLLRLRNVERGMVELQLEWT
ncbi:hypothetical protein ACH5RR_031844 [Cinchona calisaya]|uniref:C2 domain-containing protein n=1 Tax=Cinchona calisaya TaxID=153742 RepID=A0ABD2YKT8_9GENT